MPKLGIELDNNINKTTSDFKTLNKEIDKTDKGVKNIEKSSSKLGKTMGTAFKTFLIGGAIQRGFSKILSDIDETNRKAKVLADSLRTLRFLGSATEVESARDLQRELTKFGIQPGEVGPAAANVLSTAGSLPLETREQILRESGAAQAGGVGPLGGFSSFLATGAQADPQFQSPAGITKLANFGAQGITEAKLPPERFQALEKAVLIGLNGGLSAPEAFSAFAILSKIESSDDAANEKLKQLLKSWAVSGARDNGISFIGYVQATAQKGIKDLKGEEVTLQGPTIKPFAKQSAIFAAQTKRIAAAGAGGSLTAAAFQKQLADPQTRQNILNEEQAGLQSLVASDPKQRASTEALSDVAQGVFEGVTAAFKTGLSLSPAGLLSSAGSALIGEDAADIGGILRTSARSDVEKASQSLDFATKALENNTQTTQSTNANNQVTRKLGGNE